MMRIERKWSMRLEWNAALLTVGMLCVAAVLAGCQAGMTSANGGNPPPQVTDATISFCDDGQGSCTPETQFSAASMRDLVINVNWENLTPGNHTQLLEVLQPDGGLYQANQRSFLVGGASQSSQTISRTIPVAGAWIGQRHMTGEWSVRVSLDGKAITTQAVRLNP